LIVDEPTAGLDPEERVRLRNLFSEAAKRATVILSTHIVEDISQSCTALAVMQRGTVRFQGAPAQLINAAKGQVWHVLTDGDAPQDVTVVSSLQLQDGVQYRVLGALNAGERVTAATPSLEDGYMLLMRDQAARS
jgi:ABC-2 type transport system ATP-binding protein